MRAAAVAVAVAAAVSLLAGPAVGAGTTALSGVGTDAGVEAGLGAGTAPGSGGANGVAGAFLQSGFDRSTVVITVRRNGDARWTFRYERTLESDEERRDFEAFAEEFRTNETPLYENFRTNAEALVADAANATGRGMSATGFDRDAFVESSLGTEVGVVEMSFTWTAFGVVEGERVRVGDVFEGGLYVGPDQTLVVRAGEGLAFASVTPEGTQSNPESLARSDSVTWEGEREFTDERPRAEFVPAASVTGTPTATTAPATTAATTAAPAEGGGGDVGPAWFFGVALLAGGLGAAAWYRTRGGDGGAAPGGGAPGDGGSGAATAGEAGSAAGDAPVEAGGADEGSVGEPAVPVEELLSDEDRVVRMLEREGGRMKQSRIVDETDWSKSKVSVLLSEMEEAGTVSKLRVGRENVVSLDGHEPEAASSPFDEE